MPKVLGHRQTRPASSLVTLEPCATRKQLPACHEQGETEKRRNKCCTLWLADTMKALQSEIAALKSKIRTQQDMINALQEQVADADDGDDDDDGGGVDEPRASGSSA